MKRALITGMTGQDGAYLSKFLLEQGYQVYWLNRGTGITTTERLRDLGIAEHDMLLDGDVMDQGSILQTLRIAEPDEVYNRGPEFVTRKVTDGPARIKHGLARELRLGNLDAHRDWGFADDYVQAMWLMLQQEEPDDYVVATGESHSVKELLEHAFAYAGTLTAT